MTFPCIKLSDMTFLILFIFVIFIYFLFIKSHKTRTYLRFTNTHLDYLKSLLYVAGHAEFIWDNCEVFIKISWKYSKLFFSVCRKLLLARRKVYVKQQIMINAAGSNYHAISYYLISYYTYPRVNYRELEW